MLTPRTSPPPKRNGRFFLKYSAEVYPGSYLGLVLAGAGLGWAAWWRPGSCPVPTLACAGRGALRPGRTLYGLGTKLLFMVQG